jgi:hypothetical protein
LTPDVGLRVPPVPLSPCVAVTITRSPTRHPVTGSARLTWRAPFDAVAPSFIQVRLIGAPWKSIRPPQQTMDGHVCRSIPSTYDSRITADCSGPIG